MILTTCGLFFGGIALQYKSLLILYLLCALPCGFGGLAIYQRLVFIHQLWFKKIGKQNIGTFSLLYFIFLFFYFFIFLFFYFFILYYFCFCCFYFLFCFICYLLFVICYLLFVICYFFPIAWSFNSHLDFFNILIFYFLCNFIILGAGVFGFAIGFWTVLFFLLSTPILKALPIHGVLYIYATLCPAVVLLPLLAG